MKQNIFVMEKEAEKVLITDLLKAAMVCRVLAAMLLQLTHFRSIFHFHRPRKRQKTPGFV